MFFKKIFGSSNKASLLDHKKIMTNNISIAQWNELTVNIVHAMSGSISSNFRRVVLYLRENKWILEIILQEDDVEDRDEIDYCRDVMEGYDYFGLKWDIEIKVTTFEMTNPNLKEGRIIYWRREW